MIDDCSRTIKARAYQEKTVIYINIESIVIH